MLILDFNDSELRIADGNSVLAKEPGIALLEGDRFLLGRAAAAKSRLNPRASYRRFWDQLDQQPLNRAAGSAQTHADIAYFHLQSLWQSACAKLGATPSQLILAVPAQYGAERLALLLGIASACGIPVVGVVDSAVLAAAAAGVPCRYLDISQHRVYHSVINGDGALSSADELSQQGLEWCYEQSIKLIAAQFMAETRFDPLHEAASEQRLFDELPQWLLGFARAERLPMTLPAGQRQHRIEVARSQILEQLQPLYSDIERKLNEQEGHIVLSHRLAALPGLSERLGAGILSDSAIFASGFELREAIISNADSPVWVKQLSLGAIKSDGVIGSARTDVGELGATHLLCGNDARPLSTEGISLISANGDAECGVQVVLENGQPVLKSSRDRGDLRINGATWRGDYRVLQLGDQLECDEGKYSLIRVVGGS